MGHNDEPVPGPSGLARSRSPIKTKSQRDGKANCSKPRKQLGAEDDVTSSDEYSSPRAIPTRKRHQPLSDQSGSNEGCNLSETTRDRIRTAEGSCSSSTDEGTTKPKRKSKKKKKKKNTLSAATTTVVNIEELRAQAAGKQGRPPTTGQYCKLAEKKKALNDEKERER